MDLELPIASCPGGVSGGPGPAWAPARGWGMGWPFLFPSLGWGARAWVSPFSPCPKWVKHQLQRTSLPPLGPSSPLLGLGQEGCGLHVVGWGPSVSCFRGRPLNSGAGTCWRASYSPFQLGEKLSSLVGWGYHPFVLVRQERRLFWPFQSIYPTRLFTLLTSPRAIPSGWIQPYCVTLSPCFLPPHHVTPW